VDDEVIAKALANVQVLKEQIANRDINIELLIGQLCAI
jgi:hypothetical protein